MQRHWTAFNQHKTIYDQPQPVIQTKISKVIESKFKPDIPIHMGQVYKSKFCSDWRSSIFEQYDKMRDSVSLSKPFLKETLPPSSLILNSRLAFAVKLTGLQDYYELKSRLCANGSTMVEGVDFDLSFCHVADTYSTLLIFNIAAMLGLRLYFYDISNAFQSTVKPSAERHHINLPPLYLDWYNARWPKHKINIAQAKEYCIQCLRCMQGEKDAGHKFNQLLIKIFASIHIKPILMCKGIFVLYKEDTPSSYLAVATDDIILAAPSRKIYDLLATTLRDYFTITTTDADVINFLNYRIIQSSHGISIDQTDHIHKNVLNAYFPDKTMKIPHQTSPFPLDPKFENVLFHALPLTNAMLQDLEEKFHGGFGHWVGALQHIQEKSRPDLGYSLMRLSGYLSAPTMPCFQVLHQTMCYLYHHPHVPIMYPRDVGQKSLDSFNTHIKSGRAELRDPDNFKGLIQSSDADLARDLVDRRSTSCVILEYNGVIFYWGCNKQPNVAPSTNASEIRAMFHGSKLTIQYRRFFQSLGSPIPHPTPVLTDSETTLT